MDARSPAHILVASLLLSAGLANPLHAETASPRDQEDAPPETELDEIDEAALRTLVTSSENPELERRVRRQAENEAERRQEEELVPVVPSWEQERDQPPPETILEADLYGSVRVHAINAYDGDSGDTDAKVGDGASRIGGTAEMKFASGWDLYGRLEYGFDVLDSFTPKAQFDTGAKLPLRLAYLGVDSEYLNLQAGKSWSVYYKVAGAADLYNIFGGNALGVYNAGTDGGAAGTGRADDALQTQVYIDLGEWIKFKPFNINLQYQWNQEVPGVEGEQYDYIYSLSTWFEHWQDIGIGLAHHHANLEEDRAAALVAAGMDGDTRASAIAFKTYGDKWLASLVYGQHDNLETTERGAYINAEAAELFVQRQISDRWWVIGGGNWLLPDRDDPDAGDYKVAYGVLGLRYTFDGLNRMLYAEWKDDHGTNSTGRSRRNELTFGLRWDLDH